MSVSLLKDISRHVQNIDLYERHVVRRIFLDFLSLYCFCIFENFLFLYFVFVGFSYFVFCFSKVFTAKLFER